MKYLLAFFALVAAGIVCVTFVVPSSVVSEFEKTAYFVPSEKRNESALSSSEEVGEDFLPAEKSEEEGSVLRFGGTFRRVFDRETPEAFVCTLEEKLTGCLHYDGVPDYKSFAFRDRMQPLAEPLSDDEVAFVFYRIVASCTPAVPIKGTLEEISFERSGAFLSARAVLTLDFKALSEFYSISFLPPSATFVLTVPFEIKNSEISVCSEKIELRSESFLLPKTLLIFGCNAAFGKKDYQSLFGEAVENVFVNAGIYGESIARAR